MANLRDYLFYEEPGITLYCGDCRDIVPLLTGLVDVVLTDPPYGETTISWDYTVREWIGPIGNLLSAAGSLWCFGSLRAFMRTAAEWRDWNIAQDIVWEKHNGSSFHNDRFRRVHEHIVQFYRGSWADVYKSPVFTMDATSRVVRKKAKPPHWHGAIGASMYVSEDGGPRLMRSVLRCKSEHGDADHPTQKPLGILRPVIAYSCPPGGTVLDPFAGSGSMLEAAKIAGARAIGIEIEPRYCEIAARRLRQEVLPFSG